MSHCALSPAAAAATTARPALPGLQRKCACGQSATAMSAQCPQCQQAERYGPPSVLSVAPSGDIHEQEADRAAEQVMRDRAPGARGATAPPRLQRLSDGPAMAHTPPVVQSVLRGAGAPLDGAARRFFEPRFGHDFSRVRVHHDREADIAAKAVDARAFTFGQQIVFGAGEYAPQTPSGRQLMAHELAHTVQQGAAARLQRKGKGPGSCGLLDAATATMLGGAAHAQIQTRLATRGLAVEMPIPRATKTAGVISLKCQPDGTLLGRADVARIARPRVAISEIKPFWSAGVLGRAEAMHYRRRATQSKQRLTGTGRCGKRPPGIDDLAFSSVAGPFTAASAFDLLKGAITGIEDFGPFSLDPTRTLRAKEVGKGAIGYWCVKKKASKKKSKKKDGKKKTKAKAKAKPKKPKAPKPKAPKPQGSVGAGNVGFGISIFSANVGGANAGVGVSVGSTSASFGTAGAGISWFSDTAAAGAVGAGVSKDSMSAAAGAAGLGTVEDSESVGVGVAGVGTVKGSSSAAAGAAGAGHAEDTQAAAAGVAGKGEVKDSTVAVAGATGSGKVSGAKGASTGSPKKPIDPKDVTGPDADKVPAGEESAEGDAGVPGGEAKAAGTGEGKGAGSGQGAGDGGTGDGKAAGSKGEGQGAGDSGADATPGEAGTGTAATPPAKGGTSATAKPGTSTTAPLGVLPILPFGASDADFEKAAAEAAKVAKLLGGARDPQTQLLKHLADSDPSGQYLVPASQWVEKLLNVTRDLTADDIAYIKTLDWRPGSLSEDEMRKRIAKALENKDKPKAEGDKQGSGDAGEATPGAGKGSGSGGKAGGGKKKEGSAPAGEGGKTASDSGRYTQARPFTGEFKDGYVRDYQFVTSGNPITAKTKVGDTPTMTLQWIGDDKKAYYYRLKYTVTEGPTEKVDDKNPNIRWLYFTLASTNSDIIDLAPEGQKPFLMRPEREAWYRVEKP